MHEEGIGCGQSAAPHGVVGADYQQLARLPREDFLGMGPDEGQQGEDVHAPHVFPHRRADGDVGAAQGGAAAAQLASQDPAGGTVEQALGIVDAETVLADPRPAGFHRLPALGQFEPQARDQFGAIHQVEARARYQVIATQQRPVRGHARIETAVTARMADPHPVGQAGLAAAGRPGAVGRVVLRPAAAGLEVAVVALVAQVETQAAHRLALLQEQADFGLVALGQEAHLIVEIDPLGRPQRGAQGQQEGGQQKLGAGGHRGWLPWWV
ncbi:hypothetical protein FQZ97_912960 [compost metagenome]